MKRFLSPALHVVLVTLLIGHDLSERESIKLQFKIDSLKKKLNSNLYEESVSEDQRCFKILLETFYL